MHDDTQVARVYEMGKALKDGVFPVRWVQDLGYGYGYPIYNFYSPLPYYLGGFLNIVGFNPLIATKIVFVTAIVLAGVAMYLFIENFMGSLAGFVAGILYLYFPYHAVDTYVRGDLDELFAYAILPFVLLGFYRIFYTTQQRPQIINNLKWIVLFSVSIAFLILSHNLTSYMLLILLFPLVIFSLIYSKNNLKFLSFIIFALLLGFLLSSFYTIPAIFEMKYTNINSQIGGGANFLDHFVCALQYWDSPWGFGGSTSGCIDGLSFRIGKTNLIFFVISVIFYLYLLVKNKYKNNRFIFFSSIFLLIFVIFLTFDISSLIWQNVPFMPFLQYPWRFLNFIGLFISISIGLFIFGLKGLFSNKMIYLVSVIIILSTFFINFKLFKSQFYTSNDLNYSDSQYLKWTVSKISDEYMPINFNKPKSVKELPHASVQIVEGDGEISNSSAKTDFISTNLYLITDSSVRLNIAYFPAWSIYVNGKLEDYIIKNDGLYINLKKGKYNLQARFRQTAIERASNVLSIVGIFITIIAIIKYINYAKKTS